jgi:hypothetical protein
MVSGWGDALNSGSKGEMARAKIPMTREAKSQSMTNDQAPMTKRSQPNAKSPLPLGIESWDLGFDWDLAPWSLVIPAARAGS